MSIILEQSVIAFILIFIRITSFMMIIPIFTTTNIPNSFKVLFGYFLSVYFFQVGNYELIVNYKEFSHFVISCIYEFINGISLGFVIIFMTNAIYTVGQIVDTNIGFSIVSVLSPTNEEEMPITANLYYMMFMIIFLVTNSHHNLIEAISIWLTKIPLGSMQINIKFLSVYNSIIIETFIIGIKMALPVLVSILICDLILGILSKAMPGLNVFLVGMPFKVLIGLIIILFIFESTVGYIGIIVEKILYYIKIFILKT